MWNYSLTSATGLQKERLTLHDIGIEQYMLMHAFVRCRADHEDDNVEYEPLATEANTSPSPEDDGDNNDGATKRARKAGGCKKRPSNISIKVFSLLK